MQHCVPFLTMSWVGIRKQAGCWALRAATRRNQLASGQGLSLAASLSTTEMSGPTTHGVTEREHGQRLGDELLIIQCTNVMPNVLDTLLEIETRLVLFILV